MPHIANAFPLAASFKIMSDQILLLLYISPPIVGLIVVYLIRPIFRNHRPWRKIYIQSFVYALFFGSGIFGGGGGDPGFALPAPVITAAITDYDTLLNNSVYPFLIWWGVILAFLVAIHLYNTYLSGRHSRKTDAGS